MGFTPIIAKQLIGYVDNSAYPLIEVNIQATLVLPANAKGLVPVLMLFGPSSLPAPAQPAKEDLEKINDVVKEVLWLDQQGSYMATVATGSVFKLLGAKDLAISNDYHTEKCLL